MTYYDEAVIPRDIAAQSRKDAFPVPLTETAAADCGAVVSLSLSPLLLELSLIMSSLLAASVAVVVVVAAVAVRERLVSLLLPSTVSIGKNASPQSDTSLPLLSRTLGR